MLAKVAMQDACLSCGACCAFFRVSFYWAEALQMPENLTEAVTPVYACMKGTNQENPCCIALKGTIGEQVACDIYEMRSSSCKEVQIADAKCNKARLAHQMIPFTGLDSEEF